jgi:hypothetical protein
MKLFDPERNSGNGRRDDSMAAVRRAFSQQTEKGVRVRRSGRRQFCTAPAGN